MAKIKDLKFEIKGEQFSVNVNCTSGGQFTANIPSKVADALHLNNKLSFHSLKELEKSFFDAINRYKTAETTEELFIAIRYGANGRYNKKPDGSVLFGQHGTKYYINNHFDDLDVLGFDFVVCIKETIDSKVNWFEARLGKDYAHFAEEHQKSPEKYYKDGTLYHIDNYKMIPFSQKALETLRVAEEKIRQASETLFNFISQDELAIEETLTKQKLLS